jgi:ADP-heptose:LPS heptosyltransferase
MKTGKSFKVFGFRGSLVGDGLMSMVLLSWVRKRFPDCYTYWQVARQHAHAAPLYFNHPLIDQIVISDCDEGMGPRDREIAAQCDLVFNVMPQHPLQHDWPNFRGIYEETFAMGALPLGIPLSEFHAMSPDEQRPKLVKWFNVIKGQPKMIALWPCAGYGVENKRNPSKEWYEVLVAELTRWGYYVIQYGHPRDFQIQGVLDRREFPFFEQVKMTVGADLVISTDSGSGLIFGAYEMRQLTLLTDHFPGHVRNLTAFAPNNPFNHNFVGVGSADRISQADVVSKVREILT